MAGNKKDLLIKNVRGIQLEQLFLTVNLGNIKAHEFQTTMNK